MCICVDYVYLNSNDASHHKTESWPQEYACHNDRDGKDEQATPIDKFFWTVAEYKSYKQE